MIRVWRHPRAGFLGAVLALLAVAGALALSGWHDAKYHDDATAAVAGSVFAQDAQDKADTDAPLHVAAHAISQWIAAPDQAIVFDRPAATALDFAKPLIAFTAVHRLTALLRPPRG